MLAPLIFLSRIAQIAAVACMFLIVSTQQCSATTLPATKGPLSTHRYEAQRPGGYRIIYAFQGGRLDGERPMAALLPAPDGSFFGTTFTGVSDGTVYRIAPIASGYSETVVFAFGGAGGPGGDTPEAPVTFDSGGALFGTTYTGGGDMREGGVYKLTPSTPPPYKMEGSVGFPATAGYPVAGLFAARSGRMFGTDPDGGDDDCNGGYIFSFKRGLGDWRSYNFQCDAHDGSGPEASFIEDQGGALYSTTVAGGMYNRGTVFRLVPKVSGYVETPIYSFSGGADGSLPSAAVVWAGAGRMIGTTQGGGTSTCSCGAVFELDKTRSGYAEHVLYSFQGGDDGSGPAAAVVLGANGTIYGTTTGGGSGGFGTVFKLTPSRGKYKEQVLHAFQGGADGAFPVAPLVSSNGTLFGTTEAGGGSPCTQQGATGCGTVYSLPL